MGCLHHSIHNFSIFIVDWRQQKSKIQQRHTSKHSAASYLSRRAAVHDGVVGRSIVIQFTNSSFVGDLVEVLASDDIGGAQSGVVKRRANVWLTYRRAVDCAKRGMTVRHGRVTLRLRRLSSTSGHEGTDENQRAYKSTCHLNIMTSRHELTKETSTWLKCLATAFNKESYI